MARYERTYSGPKRTAALRVQLTPEERAELEEAATQQGAPKLSIFVRELLFRRAAAVVAATRRNPEAKAIMEALEDAGGKLNATGNNLNQLMRHLHTVGGDPLIMEEVREALESYRQSNEVLRRAASRVLDL
jgi:uncharacterized protein (DUF1778 family)